MEKSLKWQLLFSRFFFAVMVSMMSIILSQGMLRPFELFSFVFIGEVSWIWSSIAGLIFIELTNVLLRKKNVSFGSFLEIWRKLMKETYGNSYLNKYGTLGMLQGMNIILFIFCVVLLGRPIWENTVDWAIYIPFLIGIIYETWRDPLRSQSYKEITGKEVIIPVK